MQQFCFVWSKNDRTYQAILRKITCFQCFYFFLLFLLIPPFPLFFTVSTVFTFFTVSTVSTDYYYYYSFFFYRFHYFFCFYRLYRFYLALIIPHCAGLVTSAVVITLQIARLECIFAEAIPIFTSILRPESVMLIKFLIPSSFFFLDVSSEARGYR